MKPSRFLPIYDEYGVHRLHPLTNEVELTFEETVKIIAHIKAHQDYIVLGGDVMDTHHKHTYNNWYYDPDEAKSWSFNAEQSCIAAERYFQFITHPTNFYYILVLAEYNEWFGRLGSSSSK